MAVPTQQAVLNRPYVDEVVLVEEAVAISPDLGERYLDTVYQTNWVQDLYGDDVLSLPTIGGFAPASVGTARWFGPLSRVILLSVREARGQRRCSSRDLASDAPICTAPGQPRSTR
jgi:hypothetical protein